MTCLIVLAAGGARPDAARLADDLRLTHIDAERVLAEEVARDSVLGREIVRAVERRGAVDDIIELRLVRTRLERLDARHGFVLEGYPRTSAQVAILDEILKHDGRSVDAAIALGEDAADFSPVAAAYARRGILRRIEDVVPDVVAADRVLATI